MSPITLAIEIVLAVLLATCLFYFWRLDQKLQALRTGQDGALRAAAELAQATAQAEAAVRAMQARLREWEATPFFPTIPALVAHGAATAPDRPVCDFIEDNERVTRAELEAQSNRLANALVAIGLRKGAVVGQMLPNRREYPITWVALAKIGAIVVPINPRYTERERNGHDSGKPLRHCRHSETYRSHEQFKEVCPAQ